MKYSSCNEETNFQMLEIDVVPYCSGNRCINKTRPYSLLKFFPEQMYYTFTFFEGLLAEMTNI